MKTNRFLLLLLLTFSTTLLQLQPGYAQSDIDTEKLDQFFTALEDNDRFMGSAAVMNGNEVVFEEAYGIISESGVPASTESIYRIGSITKSYTSTMILRLIEQGNLALETTLDTYYPDMPNADQITIEQMLRHQSGLVNFTSLPAYMEYFTDDRSRADILEIFESVGTSFEPGEDTEYSNTAYVLLGYIVEKAAGLNYADALREMITEPLDLTSTYFAAGINPDRNEADSFTFQEGNWQPSTRTNMEIPHGAGAIVSTAKEVARFYHGLLNGELLSDESLEKMRTFEGPFGLGLVRFPFNEKTLIGHNGGIDGYQSNAAHYPEEDFTFTVLGNGVNYAFNDILIGLLSISFGNDYDIPSFEEKTSISLAEDELSKYAGTYQSPQFPLAIELFADDGNLMAQATGQGAFPLTIYDERAMGFEQAGIEIEFEEPEGDRYTAFVFSQAGQSYRFTLEE